MTTRFLWLLAIVLTCSSSLSGATRNMPEAPGNAALMLPVGYVAPDFTFNDFNGKPLKLSSLRGKYVVLDFWASWCGWCIKGFPEMKRYYAKYKDRLEILGMNCGDTEARWKQAVANNNLPWLNVIVPRESRVPVEYGVKGLPTKVIINPEGRVLVTTVGENPRFYEILDALLVEK